MVTGRPLNLHSPKRRAYALRERSRLQFTDFVDIGLY